MPEIKHLDRDSLVSLLKSLVNTEIHTTTEIISVIQEFDRQKLYLGLGYTSLFAYLVKEIGYAPASAQRRIDAARLSRDVPELKAEIESGAVNLTQVSMIAQGLRQKRKTDPKYKPDANLKRSLIEKAKNQNLEKTQILVAQDLELEIKQIEKKHHQRDESVRVETVYSKEGFAELERVKELISHSHPNATVAELTIYLARYFLKQKDPLRKSSRSTSISATPESANRIASESTSAAEVTLRRRNSDTTSAVKVSVPRLISNAPSRFRPYVSASNRRQVFQIDRCCQWKNPATGEICGSRFQLQVDHIRPVWAGGGSGSENLQILCGTHNRLKYEIETGPKGVSDWKVNYLAATG